METRSLTLLLGNSKQLHPLKIKVKKNPNKMMTFSDSTLPQTVAVTDVYICLGSRVST